jgi:hypothetical protein
LIKNKRKGVRYFNAAVEKRAEDEEEEEPISSDDVSAP